MALQGFTKKDQEMIRKAWIINGYADHFLQDSFAAGHLINKTLIMQWFVEWVKDYNSKTKKWERNIHLDNADKVEHMTTGEQPGLAGRNLYGKAWTPVQPVPPTRKLPRNKAQNRDRMNASGVQAGGGKDQSEEYNNYLAFLNNSVIQSASGALHNYFNSRSLLVSSVAHKDAYQIWGDDTMVASGEGVRLRAKRRICRNKQLTNWLARAQPLSPLHIFVTSFRAVLGLKVVARCCRLSSGTTACGLCAGIRYSRMYITDCYPRSEQKWAKSHTMQADWSSRPRVTARFPSG